MVYFISDGSDYIKIGITTDLDARIKQLQCGNPKELNCLYTVECIRKRDQDIETELHSYFNYLMADTINNASSEWFKKEVLDILEKDNWKLLTEILRVSRDSVIIKAPKRVPYSELANRVKNMEERLKEKNDEVRKLQKQINKYKEDARVRTLREVQEANEKLEEENKRLANELKNIANKELNTLNEWHSELPPPCEANYLTLVENSNAQKVMRIMAYGFVNRKGVFQWDWKRNPAQTNVISWKYLDSPPDESMEVTA